MPAKTKVMKQLSAVYLVRDTPAATATTLTAASAAGATTITVAATTGMAAGGIVRVGAAEEMELARVASIAGLVVTLSDPLAFTHASGEQAMVQTAYDLGDVEGAGVNIEFSGNSSDVNVATRRTVFTSIDGYVAAMASFSIPTITLNNLLVALGIPLTGLTGSGTLAAPFHLVTDGNEFNSDQNQSLIVQSVLMDGTFLREELWGVDADYSGLTFNLTRGSLDSIPVTFVASAGGVITTTANPYTPNVTQRSGKGKVFDSLSEVGLFTAATTGPLSTTTTAAAAAGAGVLALTAVTNLVAGDWIQVNAGENVEFHQIDSIATLNANLRTKLLRAQASGTAVVRQTTIPFAGVHEDGVELAVNGAVDPVRIATRRMQAGLRPGFTGFRMGFKLIDLVLANFARALGIPQSAIVGGNRLVLGPSTIASATQVDGVYVRGLHQDGGTIQINLWGCSTDVGSIATAFTNSGISNIPVALKPASGVQFLSY